MHENNRSSRQTDMKITQCKYTEEVLIVMAVGELDSAETSTLSP